MSEQVSVHHSPGLRDIKMESAFPDAFLEFTWTFNLMGHLVNYPTITQ